MTLPAGMDRLPVKTTKRTVVRILREIAAQYPEWRNPRCALFAATGEPLCIIGQVFDRLGFRADNNQVKKINLADLSNPVNRVAMRALGFTDAATKVLGEVQVLADGRKVASYQARTWGAAVKEVLDAD